MTPRGVYRFSPYAVACVSHQVGAAEFPQQLSVQRTDICVL